MTGLEVRPGGTVLDALRVIDEGGIRGAVEVDSRGRLTGILTDGDIRRALLRGLPLDAPVETLIQRNPLTVSQAARRADVVDLMRSRDVSFVPILDQDGVFVGVHLLNEVITREVLPNTALIMAGGRGSRLGELTQRVPKPLLRVAGRPVIEWILLHLLSEGIRDFFVSTGYLAHMIEDHLGDGSAYGCSVRYLRDPTDHSLGSGGALGLLHGENLTAPLIAINGDLMTRFDLASMLAAHHRLGNGVTIASLTYSVEIPFGVLETNKDGHITAVSEKPSASWPVNAGIYVINPQELPALCPERELPMTTFIQDCLARGVRVGGWEIDGDWIDIGRPEDLNVARGAR